MGSVTSSFRLSEELNRRLSDAAKRSGMGKNALIIDALSRYLGALDRDWLAVEARRQSELVSQNSREDGWYDLADTSGWK